MDASAEGEIMTEQQMKELFLKAIGENTWRDFMGSDAEFFAMGYQAGRASQQVPEGYVIVPIDPTQAQIIAIEQAIDVQLTASAIRPADMFRQDGETIYLAMLSAAPSAPGRGE